MSEDKILKETTKTVTEKGLFQPKSVAAKELAKKALRATTIGKIAAGVAGAGLAAKAYLKSKMKDKKEFPDDPIGKDMPESKMGGGMMKKYSSGGDTKLSPKQMKIARMAPPTNKITGADFKAMKASNGKMVMSRGCKMGRNKPTKLS